MDEHIQQIFDIRYVKIGGIVNAGVVQIGCGTVKAKEAVPVAYTTVGSTLVHLKSPVEFSVPLQAPIRPK